MRVDESVEESGDEEEEMIAQQTWLQVKNDVNDDV